MKVKPDNMSRRGFLRLLGITSLSAAVPGLFVPPAKIVEPVGLLLPKALPAKILVEFQCFESIGMAVGNVSKISKIEFDNFDEFGDFMFPPKAADKTPVPDLGRLNRQWTREVRVG